MSGALLQVRDVSRVFAVRQGLLAEQGYIHAVSDVSLDIPRGEILGLVGESGCGKSTLGRMVAGLLQPSNGAISLDGMPVMEHGRVAHAGKIQMIFQDPFSSLNPRMTVGNAIAEPLAIQNVPRKERRERVAQLLELVGLSVAQAGRFPHEFSGGQRQRIAVARALITHPELIVCDEPVSALDASVQAQVLNLLKDVHERFQPAYLFVSHDLAVVGFLCQHIAIMYLGKLMEMTTKDALFTRPAHPYTQALLQAMPRHSAQNTPPALLQGELPSPLAPPPGCSFHPRCTRAMDICRTTAPRWTEIAPAHSVRCHLYQ